MTKPVQHARAPRAVLVASHARSLVLFRLPLVRELHRRGYMVDAMAPHLGAEVIKALRNEGATTTRVPLRRRSRMGLGDVVALAKLWRRARSSEPGDVFVPYTLKPILLTGLALRASGSRAALVPMFTGIGALPALIRRPGGQGIRRLIAWAIRDARAVITHNDHDAEWLRSHGIVAPTTPVDVVPGSGVDTGHFTPTPLATEGLPVVLFVGRLLPEKGIHRFVEWCRQATFPARWVVVGDFDDRQNRKKLTREFHEAGVQHVGRVDDVRPWLAAARVVVLPTTYGEGIPRTILEAMACGRPVVVSGVPGCRAAVRDGVEGYVVDPTDTRGAFRAVERLCRDDPRARQIGQAGRLRCEREFDAARVAHLTADAVLGEISEDPQSDSSAAATESVQDGTTSPLA